MNLLNRVFLLIAIVLISLGAGGENKTQDWPSFRGPGGRGVADGFSVPSSWNADPSAGKVERVKWKTHVPGLSHSSPIVFGDRIFLATVVSEKDDPQLKLGSGGAPTAADDNNKHRWVILCYNKLTGEELWQKTAYEGIPRVSRHVKATQANTTLTTEGSNLVAFFGSEGLYCYDLDGKLKWSRDLGIINISKYGIGWGYASSPALHKDRIVLVCDDPDNPFMVIMRLSDGKELLRVNRKGICERSWGTPMIYPTSEGTQVVVNGWPWIVSYDLETGKEIWKINGGGDNPVPTPFEANGWIYITSSHGRYSPIFVVRPGASGDITPPKDESGNESIVWSVWKGGSYMSTPVVYRGYIYLGNYNGNVRCFNAVTGEKVFNERVSTGSGIISSLVAAEGKIYCAAEDGTVYVLAAGPELKILASNALGEPCFATPAISQGVLYFRTTKNLIAIE